MLTWDSYPTVYRAELRAAAREYADHGWPVGDVSVSGLVLTTGTTLDVLEVPAAVGRLVCGQLRAAVAATPTGTWWYPVQAGAAVPSHLRGRVVLRTAGVPVVAPPSETPDGWVHWRVAPALFGYRTPAAAPILAAISAAIEQYDSDRIAVAARR